MKDMPTDNGVKLEEQKMLEPFDDETISHNAFCTIHTHDGVCVWFIGVVV